eukprot:366463-Chlamydomonas_euryale.AAC.3
MDLALKACTPYLPASPWSAQLMTESPVLTGLVPPGDLSFGCTTPPVLEDGHWRFTVCAGGSAAATNAFSDALTATNTLYPLLATEALGLAQGAASCLFM